METTLERLKSAIENAPEEAGPIADGLLGWQVEALQVCSDCAGRIFQRGCDLGKASPIWTDSQAVNCCLC